MANENAGQPSDGYRKPPMIKVWVLYTVWALIGSNLADDLPWPRRQGSLTIEVPNLEYLTGDEFETLLYKKASITETETVIIQQVILC